MTKAAGNPIFKVDQFNGLPAVRFDGASDNYFSFALMTDIRTVFWVMRENPAAMGQRFLLGDSRSGQTYHFHRGSVAPYYMWHPGHASLMFNGTTKVRGHAVDGRTTEVPSEFAVISQRMSGNATANSFANDRGISGRTWHGELAELIIYNRALSDAEEKSIGNFLVEKYKLQPTLFIVR